MRYTTIEQSKELVKLGLDPETADMIYFYFKGRESEGVENIPTVRENLPLEDCDVPCWSTDALFSVLPVLENDEKFYPFLGKHGEGGYICKYACNEYNGTLHWFINDTQLEACYEMLKWLIKNKYIVTKQEDNNTENKVLHNG